MATAATACTMSAATNPCKVLHRGILRPDGTVIPSPVVATYAPDGTLLDVAPLSGHEPHSTIFSPAPLRLVHFVD